MIDPNDELNVQLPGRLITIEILLVLLLRQKPDVARIMREADAMLQGIEADLHEGASAYVVWKFCPPHALHWTSLPRRPSAEREIGR